MSQKRETESEDAVVRNWVLTGDAYNSSSSDDSPSSSWSSTGFKLAVPGSALEPSKSLPLVFGLFRIPVSGSSEGPAALKG